MKNAPVRHRIEYALFVAAKLGLLRLSHARIRRIGRRIGRTAYRTFGTHRRRTLRNLRIGLPELDEPGREAVARACFEHFGSYSLEVISASRFSREEMIGHFDFEGREHLAAAEASDRGYFLMAGHYGCFELALHPIGLQVGGIHVVARSPDNPLLARALIRIRERFGNSMIDKKGAGHRMLNAYRAGGRVAVMIDQRTRPSKGIQVPFFGRPAWTSPVLAFLSLYTRAPVIKVRCVPDGDERYRLTVDPPIEPVAGRSEEAQAIMTRRYLAAIEDDIRVRPELWMWMHRRWKDAPAPAS